LQQVGTLKAAEAKRLCHSARWQRRAAADLPCRADEFLTSALNQAHSQQRASSLPPPQPDADPAIDTRVKLMTSKLRKFFFEQRSRVLAALEALDKPEEFQPETIVGQLFDKPRENEELIRILNPLLIDNCESGAKHRSADFQSAVSRISNPQAPGSSQALPTGSRRHSRLETCATSALRNVYNVQGLIPLHGREFQAEMIYCNSL
jgi:hypothetical protein